MSFSYRNVVEIEDFEKYVEMLDNLEIAKHELNKDAYVLLRSISKPTEDCGKPAIPVRMFVSIRTDKTNEMIVDVNIGNFYWDCTEDHLVKHSLDDLVLLSAKKLFEDVFSNMQNSISLMVRRSAVYPVGSLIDAGEVKVYVNIAIDHTLRDEPLFFLKEEYKFVKIEDLQSDYLGDKFKRSLAIVEEGE